MAQASVPAPIYHDNLAEARSEGRTGGHDHRPPVATKDVREVAAKLLDDEKYQQNLQKRLNAGEAGAMEVWLWRWRYGDPKRATDAEGSRDREHYAEIRKEIRLLIQTPGLHAELEERVLARGAVPAPQLPARAPVQAVPELPGPVDAEEWEDEQ